MKDFFVSYNQADRTWAEWIAWQLEEAGYAVIVQAWDIRPGSNFILEMHKAARETERTIAVLSPAYLSALYTQPEWAAALVQDPTGAKKKLLPVRVQDCSPDGLLAVVAYVDLVGKDETEAPDILLSGVKQERAKPVRPPTFPQSDQRCVPEHPRFPSVPQSEKKEKRWFRWTSGNDENLESRNRQAMLDKVRQYWITGVLQQSLYNEVMITLGLTERPTAVVRPLDVLVQRPDGTDRLLPAETHIGEVFDECGGSLLILGAPGSGKTILLLELARDLLDHAEQDSGFPIPVVFPLSTWGERRLPLAGWLIDELTKRYDVPQKVAQTWIEQDRVLPLLDGLDEVKEDHRAVCVEAINAFRKAHGFLLPLAVCCRVADYEAIGKPLRLQGAIIVQPLTKEQVDAYLAEIGEPLAAVRQVLQDDPTLQELLDTPLMLHILTLACAGRPMETLQTAGSSESGRQRLFRAYVEQMFQRRVIPRYSQVQTVQWLAWLARQMVQHSQTIFYIERMQPDWLPPRQQRVMVRRSGLIVTLLFALVLPFGFGLPLGLLVGLANGLVRGIGDGLIYGLVVGLVVAPIIGLVVALPLWLASGQPFLRFLPMVLAPLLGGPAVGLAVGLVSWLLRRKRAFSSATIKSIESVYWSWSAFRSKLSVIPRYMLGFWLVFGLLVGLASGQAFRLEQALPVSVVLGLFIGLFSALRSGLAGREIETKLVPNQGIRRSVRNALVFGLLSGLPVGLVVGRAYGLDSGLSIGLGSGLLCGSHTGGVAFLQHVFLRLSLVRNGSAPWNYPAFLDYATERVFLRKVGGGYMFIHRMLLEHFASLEAKEEASATKVAESIG